MASMKTILGKILLEVPAIVVAVFLALAVNNCNEEYRNQAAAEQTMQFVIKEIQENKAALENNISDNEIVMKALQATMDTIQGIDDISDIDVELGYEQTFLVRAAWEMAQLTGATQEFAPEAVQELSIIYDLQNMYLKQGERFFEQVTKVDFHKAVKDHPKAQLQATLTLLKLSNAIGEKALSKYIEFLEYYDSE